MQRSTRYKSLLIGVPVATLVLVGGIALAASQPSSDPAPPPANATSQAEQSDAADTEEYTSGDDLTPEEALVIEAAEIMTTWEAAEDYNETAAEERATHLMTDERAAAVTPPERPASGPEWREAAERGATSQPHAELMPYSDGDSVAVHVTWQWLSPDHNPLSGGERRFYFILTEDDQGEPLIHDYTWENAQ